MNDKKIKPFQKNGSHEFSQTANRATLDQAIEKRLGDRTWDRRIAASVLRASNNTSPGWQKWRGIAAAAIICTFMAGALYLYTDTVNAPDAMASNNSSIELDWMLEESAADQEMDDMLAGAVFME